MTLECFGVAVDSLPDLLGFSLRLSEHQNMFSRIGPLMFDDNSALAVLLGPDLTCMTSPVILCGLLPELLRLGCSGSSALSLDLLISGTGLPQGLDDFLDFFRDCGTVTGFYDRDGGGPDI